MPLCSLLAGFKIKWQNYFMSGPEKDNHGQIIKLAIMFFNSSIIKGLDSQFSQQFFSDIKNQESQQKLWQI
jgi:hypothetical protein